MSKDLKNMLDRECGKTPWTMEDRGKHKAIFIHGCNRRELVIVSRSPSDHRALLNIRGDVRRALRNLA